MTRQELEKWIGKYVYVESKEGFYSVGFFMIHKKEDIYYTYEDVDETEFRRKLGISNWDFYDIKIIKEEKNHQKYVPVHEFLGQELEGWLSKPLSEFSIDLSKYPHKCSCGSPAYIKYFLNQIECSNKNCKFYNKD